MSYRNLCSIFCTLYILCFTSVAVAQFEVSYDLLGTNLKTFIYSNPEQAITFSKLMLNKTEISEAEKVRIRYLMAKAYKIKGNYEIALPILFTDLSNNPNILPHEKLAIELEKIEILRELFFEEEAKTRLNNLEKCKLLSIDTDLIAFKKASIRLQKAEFLLLDNDFETGIQLLEPALSSINPKFEDLTLNYEFTLGKLF